MKKIIFLLFSTLLLVSCARTKQLSEIYKADNADLNSLKTGKLIIYGTSEILQQPVTEAYTELFDNKKFNNYMFHAFDSLFAEDVPALQIIDGQGILPKENYKMLINEKPIDTEADNLLLLNYVVIKDSTDSTGNTYGSAPRGTRTGNDASMKGGMVYGITRVEGFAVELNVEIWDLKNVKQVLKFESTGYQKILLSETDALESAIGRAVSAATDYIKNL